MQTENILTQPVRQIATQLRSSEVSPTELIELVLQRIEATDDDVKAYTLVRTEKARKDAEQAERELQIGYDRGPLHGLPVSVKDLIDMEGEPTTYGSPILKGHKPKEESPPDQ